MGSVKISGSWSTIKLPYARISGSWRPCKQIYVKVNGVWKIAFDLNIADPFDGSGSLSGQLTPGYVPWEVLNGTWTESGGNVSANTTNAVAAIETGVTNGEWEIDTQSTTTGGPGVGFWITDQQNWWGVRYYTEQYSFTIPGNAISYNINLRYVSQSRSAGTTNPGTFSTCFESYNYAKVITANNYVNRQTGTRTCSCNTNNNANCSTTSSNFTNACVTSCGALSYPPCTNNNKGTQTSRNCTSFGCTFCSTGPCPSCPTPFSGTFYGDAGCSPVSATNSSGAYTGCSCGCTTSGSRTRNFNSPTYNCPTPVTNSTSGIIYTNSCPPSPSTFSPCSNTTNNSAANALVSECTYVTYYAGTNPPTTSTGIYKRGQLVRSVSGVVNIISNQDFGDVGNLYAKTYGNSIDFRQYSSSGRGGTASNVVTYNSGTAGGTKHGIVITAVPYTQTYNIGRFKATI
jgi:hypothetical protein